MKQSKYIVCRICGKRKKLDAFYLDNHTSTGHKSTCKDCLRDYMRERMREIRKNCKEAKNATK